MSIVVKEQSVPIYETTCCECGSVFRYKAVEVSWMTYITCPICGVSNWASLTPINDDRTEKGDKQMSKEEMLENLERAMSAMSSWCWDTPTYEEWANARDLIEAVYTELASMIGGIEKAIDDAPTVDAEPVRHGYWEVDEDGNIKCSECGHRGVGDNYCERCGAKMDEVEDETVHG